MYVKKVDFEVDAFSQVQTFVAECDGTDVVIAGSAQNMAYNTNLFTSHDWAGGSDNGGLDQFFHATLAVSVVDTVRIIITCAQLTPQPIPLP